MTTRGEQTRDRLLDTAERMFGERGVEGVSLREIRLAAGARNTAAIQFHFGNRDGLLDALADRHMPGIAQIQAGLYEEMTAEGADDDPRRLVEVLVRPAAEYLRRGASERAWVKIMADLGEAADMRLQEMVSYAPPEAIQAGTALYAQLARTMPAVIARERIISVARISIHLCADRARLEDDLTSTAPPRVSTELFTENLVDMVVGAMFAPATAVTEENAQAST